MAHDHDWEFGVWDETSQKYRWTCSCGEPQDENKSQRQARFDVAAMGSGVFGATRPEADAG